ncbi:MAG: hypothetical protein ABIX10_04025 [Acidimicrobiales bacterium]
MTAELLSATGPQLGMLVGALLGLVVSAFVGWRIGRRRCRPLLGVVLGGLLTFPGLLAIWLMPNKEPAYY